VQNIGPYIPAAGRQSPKDASSKPRLLDQVRQAIRARHYSKRTEKAYMGCDSRLVFHVALFDMGLGRGLAG